jgi:hypothetical protein
MIIFIELYGSYRAGTNVTLHSIQLGRLSVHGPAWRGAIRLHVDRRKATVVSVRVQRP